MSGPHRNPDKLNSIGIVVVGICGAVLVYVSIVALQAFYMDDSSEIQHMADYGGQDTAYRTLRAQQLENLQRYEPKPAPQPGQATPQTYTISIDDAIALVVKSAKTDPANLVPALGPAVTPTVKPIFGRPQPLQGAGGAGGAGGAAPGGGEPAGAGAAPADGAGAGSSVPMTPTGGQGPGGGAPPGTEGRRLQDPSGAPTKVDPAPRTNPSPKADPATPAPKLEQPKAGGAAPAQPKGAPAAPKAGAAPAPAAPKAGAAPAPAAPKGAPVPAPKQPAPGPAQPKKGNAS